MIKRFTLELIRPRHLALLFLGVVGTYICVASGFDWKYFLFTYEHMPRAFLFLADGLGFLVPLFVPLGLFVYGRLQKSQSVTRASAAVLSAVLVGFFVSMCIKVFTGRISPPHHGPFDVDISSAFQFGFMEHHIIGGWPSSHATVMFALAACVWVLFPQAQRFRLALLVSAFFVALGVTFGFHWFSEFVAGACFGTIIGDAVGKVFLSRKVEM